MQKEDQKFDHVCLSHPKEIRIFFQRKNSSKSGFYLPKVMNFEAVYDICELRLFFSIFNSMFKLIHRQPYSKNTLTIYIYTLKSYSKNNIPLKRVVKIYQHL